MKTIAAVIIIGLLGFFGWKMLSSTAAENKPAGAVYFYPKANVYYDVAAGEYVYFSQDEKRWIRKSNLTKQQKLSLGERAVIDEPAAPVWKNNKTDRLIYSVNLYAPSDLQKKYRQDSINNLPKPKVAPADTAPSAPEETKEKSGFGKFLEKLFGKKKNKTKD